MQALHARNGRLWCCQGEVPSKIALAWCTKLCPADQSKTKPWILIRYETLGRSSQNWSAARSWSLKRNRRSHLWGYLRFLKGYRVSESQWTCWLRQAAVSARRRNLHRILNAWTHAILARRRRVWLQGQVWWGYHQWWSWVLGQTYQRALCKEANFSIFVQNRWLEEVLIRLCRIRWHFLARVRQ